MKLSTRILHWLGFHRFKVFPPMEEHVSVGETESNRYVYKLFTSPGYKQCAICGKIKLKK